MADYEPTIINSGVYSQTQINAEFSAIADAMADLVSRTPPGEGEDNSMYTHLDMNDYRVLNLPAPTEDTDPIRVIDLLEGTYLDTIIDALVARGYSVS